MIFNFGKSQVSQSGCIVNLFQDETALPPSRGTQGVKISLNLMTLRSLLREGIFFASGIWLLNSSG